MSYKLDPNVKTSPEQFKVYLDEMLEHCLGLLVSKNKEYARNGDKIWNFRRAAQIENTVPEKALRGMMTKHVVSVYDMIDDLAIGVKHPVEKWREKLGDFINYLILVWALVREAEDRSEKEDNPVDNICIRAALDCPSRDKQERLEKKAISSGGTKNG